MSCNNNKHEFTFWYYLIIFSLFSIIKANDYFYLFLLLARIITQHEISEYEMSIKDSLRLLLTHIMRLLNIFQHVLTNKRPVFIAKGQKTDIFVNSREMLMVNSYGYFGNDYFYLKIYKILRSFFESYKTTINSEIDLKMFMLLKSCLQSMAVILEVMTFSDYKDSGAISLIDDILIFLGTFVNYVPKESVTCIEQLFKFRFSMNFASRSFQGAKFNLQQLREIDAMQLLECLRIHSGSNLVISDQSNLMHENSTSSLINLPASTSNTERTKCQIDEKIIKTFEPHVIQCLKV